MMSSPPGGAAEQDVELRRLRLHRGIGIEPKRHQRPGVVPDVGEIGKRLFVGNPELVEHRGRRDGVERLDNARRALSGRLGRRDKMGGDASLRHHLAIERRVERTRDVGQRDFAHLGEARRQDLREVHCGRFRLVA